MAASTVEAIAELPNPAPYPSRPPHDWPAPELPPPPPPPPPEPWPSSSGGHGRAAAIVVGVVVLTLLVAVGLGALLRDGGDDVTFSSPPPAEVPPMPPAAPALPAPAPSLEEVIDDITAFVERERGLEFRTEVDVELASDDEFTERLLADAEEARDDIEDSEDLLGALGLIEPDVDLYETQLDLLGAGVVGFYDPETGELVVRGDEATPYVRTVIAHELVHALDDQHFDLDRPELDDAVDESGFGFTALVEGNAGRIEDAYAATLTDSERDEALAEELALAAGVDLGAIPLVLIDVISAPYLFGPPLVEALLDEGGQVRLDAAFDAPPTTSEQVLHPERYLADEPALPVPAPAAEPGAEVFEEGTFGEYSLSLLLGSGSGDATDDWGGDAYVAWRTPTEACVRVAVAADTPEAFDDLSAEITEWADDEGATVEESTAPPEAGSELVTFTRCG